MRRQRRHTPGSITPIPADIRAALPATDSVMKTAGAPPISIEVGARSVMSVRGLLGKIFPDTKFTLWDPFCGNGYLTLSAAQALRGKDELEQFYYSDICPRSVSATGQNLRMGSVEGVQRSIDELLARNVPSSSGIIRVHEHLIGKLTHPNLQKEIPSHGFMADAANIADIGDNIPDEALHFMLGDAPYGRDSKWKGYERGHDLPEQIASTLDVIRPKLKLSALAGFVLPTSCWRSGRRFELPKGFKRLKHAPDVHCATDGFATRRLLVIQRTR